jgi:nucleoside-diphosphate-sugar epimerase
MNHIVGLDDRILVTGAAGFIGSRVVERLLDRGFRNVRCFARPAADRKRIHALTGRPASARVEVF